MSLLNNKISMGAVVLRVYDLEAMQNFYQNVMGLRLLNVETGKSILGLNDRAMVKLVQETGVEVSDVDYNGLYHMAFLLPSEQDLTAFLFHTSAIAYDLDGAGDHGFSQAIYLHDPEGNGIEVYVDRPKSNWPYLPDGSIQGMSNAVNIEKLVSDYNGEPWKGMPLESVMGHVHLQVQDLAKAKTFYQDLLGMELQTALPSAMFISKGGYHHHLGVNAWSRTNHGALPGNKTGLIAYEINVSNYDAINEALKNQSDFTYRETSDGIEILDQQGVTTRIVKEQR